MDIFYKALTDKKVIQQKAYEYPALLSMCTFYPISIQLYTINNYFYNHYHIPLI